MDMDYQEQYCEVLEDLLCSGDICSDRTGVGTRSIFGYGIKFDVSSSFPLLPLRKLNFKTVATEVFWYLRGEDHIKYLREQSNKIWEPWADENGNVGPVYGVQWRKWNSPTSPNIDQVAEITAEIKANPNSRRLLVSAWNPADIPAMALPPCPFAFQLSVRSGGHLNMVVYQRSCDAFIGLPHDIAGHALLLYMFAHISDLTPGELSFMIGDLHLYRNHEEQARELLRREHKDLPVLEILPAGQKTMDDFNLEDFTLVGYDPHPAIKVEVAV